MSARSSGCPSLRAAILRYECFGAIVESVGTPPVQIIAERAMYTDAGGVTWAGRTSALATRLR